MSARAQRQTRRDFLKNSTIKDGILLKADPNSVHVVLDVHTIGKKAFQGCTNIKTVKAPFLHTIEDYAFDKCTSLKNIDAPLVNIGEAAFYGCTGLSQISLSDVQIIGSAAFYGCTGLDNVQFPKVQNIGNYAFAKCEYLTSVSLPDSLNSISNGTFARCTRLTNVNFPNLNTIGEFAFHYCTSLTKVRFPSLQNIENNAFQMCTRLAEIEFPDNLDTVGKYAFHICSVKQFELTARTVGYGAFAKCNELTRVNIPNVISIGDFAFFKCSKLEHITFPDKLQSIGKLAFWDSGLISVELPPKLLHIGKKAFQCRKRIEFDNLNDITQYLIGSGLKPPLSSPAYWNHFYRQLQNDSFCQLAYTIGNQHISVIKYGTLYTIITDYTGAMHFETYDTPDCPICMIPFAELPGKWTRACGHSVCVTCAENLYGRTGPKPCPICRQAPIIDFGMKSKLKL